MKFLDKINKETIIICSKGHKDAILKLHKLIPIKLMTFKEFISKYLFDYDESAILFIMQEYKIKYDVAKMYLENLYYIDKSEYKSQKLNFLSSLKDKLNDQGLLKYNNSFIKYAKRTEIIIYDIRMTKFMQKTLKGLNYKVINHNYQNHPHFVYKFNTMEEEVEYVAYKICELIDNGIDPDKIKLTNIDKSYYNTIERIFTLYNLKVDIPYNSPLASFDLVKKFIEFYRNSTLEEAIEKIDKQNVIFEQLIKVINNYLKYDNKDLIIYQLEHTSIDQIIYDKSIKIIDFLDYICDDDEYIFMLGFNDGIIPKSHKDTAFITDNIKSEIDLEPTVVLNNWLNQDIIQNINNIKNLTITYKMAENNKSCYPSNLCNNYTVVDGKIKYSDSYSESYNKIKLVSRIDNYLKYGQISEDFWLLKKNFPDSYNTYSNKYTKINRIQEKLLLSYTKMQTYGECAFKYYLSDILKLDIFEENFYTVIGNMVHFVMERCLSESETNVDKYIDEFLSGKQFTKKETFFLKKYKVAINELFNQVLLERSYSSLTQAMYEKEVKIDYGDNICFMGKIDKVLYQSADKNTYVALVDYKTGSSSVNLKYLKYGLNMQLPIYLYLLSKMPFKNPKYVGFYLQKMNLFKKDYRLQGFSNSDIDTLKMIDKNYFDSEIIKGMALNKDGSFSRYSKVMTDDEIFNLITDTEAKIQETIQKITENNFDINPKIIDGINLSCEHCQFKDICNVQEHDKVRIELVAKAEEELWQIHKNNF